jgi:hypothetical protein
MQANRDIGKIANNTPLIIAKSLELFLEEILGASSALLKEKSEGESTPSEKSNSKV